MHRRALLAAIGTASAGCLSTSSQNNPSSQTTTGHPSTGTGTPIPTAEHTRPSCGSSTKEQAESPESPPENLEYELTQLSVSTATDRPSVKYILEPASFYSKDAVAREEERTSEKLTVVPISEVKSPEVRDAIETAILSGAWESNTLPDGLAETVERVDFFTGVSKDDTYTHVGVTLHRLNPNAPPAVEFDAYIADQFVAQESPGAIVFTLINRSSQPQEIFSGTVPPFGMLYANSESSGESRFLLWREYEKEGCFRYTEDGWTRCDIGKMTRLEPCESISRRYEILPNSTTHYPEETVPSSSGSYQTSGSISYSLGGGSPSSELSFEVSFQLER